MQKLYLLLGVFFVSFGLSSAAILPTVTPVDKYASLSGSPARIAIDAAGRIYSTDPMRGVVEVFSNNGLLLFALTPTEAPLGIAVDPAGKMYISDVRKGNVGVYRGVQDADRGALLFKLGAGDGEFGLPNSIALSAAGDIFVTDSARNAVKVYAPDGSSIRSFGSGVLKFPTGITIDSSGMVYVIDHNNLAIRMYDINGIAHGVISESCGMMGCRNLLRPLGLASDSSRLYVADAYHSAVAVYDKAARTFLGYIGRYGEAINEYQTPMDVVFDAENKLFVTNSNNRRVEVLGIDSFSGLKLSPASFSVALYRGGAPVTLALQVSSSGDATSWSAAGSSPWLFLSQATGSTPTGTTVTFDPKGLSAGKYSTTVVFTTTAGIESYLPATLEVLKPALVVSRSEYDLKYQKGSSVLPSTTVSVDSVGAALPWTASSSASWLRLSKTSGITPGSIGVTLTSRVKNFAPGPYDAEIIIRDSDTTNSPVKIRVHLEVVTAGNIVVTTNLETAGFSMTGPKSFSGHGKSWTIENAAPGDYTISFDHVSGYNRPFTRTFTVTSGRTSTIPATYAMKALATHIIAGAASPDGNTVKIIPLSGWLERTITPFSFAHGVKIIPLSGWLERTITPFSFAHGVKVAAGDLNGDGFDEVIVTNSMNALRVYDKNGLFLASKSFGSSASDIEIAVGDTDNDGMSEIIVAYTIGWSLGSPPSDTRIPGLFSPHWEKASYIEAFNLKGTRLEKKKGFGLKEAVKIAQAIALGDVNGDGKKELIVSSSSSISAYALNPVSLLWRIPLNETMRPSVATGDINDDGFDEIAVAAGPAAGNESRVWLLKGDGTDFGMQIPAFPGYDYGATVALGDIDGDGIDEIGIGAGPAPANESLIKLYRHDGTFTGTTIDPFAAFFGVNVGFGKFGSQ